MNLSPLRNNKIRHNSADTPSTVQDTSHLLFACTRYATHRANWAVKDIEILQRNNRNHLGNQFELYLYGHRSLDLTENRKILSTIKTHPDFLSSPSPSSHPYLLQSYLISYSYLASYLSIYIYLFLRLLIVYSGLPIAWFNFSS